VRLILTLALCLALADVARGQCESSGDCLAGQSCVSGECVDDSATPPPTPSQQDTRTQLEVLKDINHAQSQQTVALYLLIGVMLLSIAVRNVRF
jgi:hypothetical protein